MLLSIIIPTHNGAKYIEDAISSALNVRGQVEVIVSDNASVDDTWNIISKFQDNKVRRYSHDTKMSMAAHYEFCIAKAKGDWVTIIGDDDGILPFAHEKLIEILDAHKNVDVITTEQSYYFWDGCEETYGNQILYAAMKNSMHIRKGSRLLAVLALLGQMTHLEMPKLYTGSIYSKDFVKKLKALSNGSLYVDPIPDVATGFISLLYAKKTVVCKYPLFVNGSSPKSVGLKISSKHGKSIQKEFLNENLENKIKFNKIFQPETFLNYQYNSLYCLSIYMNYKKPRSIFVKNIVKTLALAGCLYESSRRLKTINLPNILSHNEQLLMRLPKSQEMIIILLYIGLLGIMMIRKSVNTLKCRHNVRVINITDRGSLYRMSDAIKYLNSYILEI